MNFIIALPDVERFLWQALVQISNFENYGYDKNTIYVVGKARGAENSWLYNKLEKLTNARFYMYEDTRINSKYHANLVPHLLKKYFKEHPSIEPFFHTDPDVLFTRNIDFNEYLNDDIWYLSNTSSYLDSKYIRSKDEKLLNDMCNIVKIDRDLVIDNDINVGGAQYLLKNITYKFWEKVEFDSEVIYHHLLKTATIYSPKYPIQCWTSGMWGLLWNAWYFGYKTRTPKELDFCWATDNIDKWNKTSIFHNAGVVDQRDIFNKSKYTTLKELFNSDYSFISNENITNKYVEEIINTKNKYKKLIYNG